MIALGINIFNRRGGGSSGPNGAPSNLALLVFNDTMIQASFTQGSTDQDGFRLYIGTNIAGPFTVKTTGSSTPLIATLLTEATEYFFYVVAYKGSTESAPTSIVSAITYAIDLYANFIGADNVFSDGNQITAGNYGLTKGTLDIWDKSTGQIEILNNLLYGFGDNDYTDHIIYGPTFSREFGKVVKISHIQGQYIEAKSLGVCKPDHSDCANSDGNIIVNTSGNIQAKIGPAIARANNKYSYAKFDYLFFIGGFDINGQPYKGSNKTDFSYGYMVFVRGGHLPYWTLLGYSNTTAEASLRVFIAFNSNNTSPYGKGAISKISQYKINDLNINQGSIATSNNDQFTFDFNDFTCQYTPILANLEEISIYFCIDDYATPLNGYKLRIYRDTYTYHELSQIDAGTPTVIGTSAAVTYSATGVLHWTMLNGYILLNALGNVSNITLTSHLTNTKAKIVNGANSSLKDFTYYKTGKNNYYKDLLYYQEPFFIGPVAPGYNLPAETRKGHYFDASSLGMNFGSTIIGIFAYLTNGTSTMVIKYRNMTERRFVDELSFTINLRFVYTGPTIKIFIGSDPHFGYSNQDAILNWNEIILPELVSFAPDYCFIFGDLVHDADYYDSYIAAKALYPSATWYELNGNHDLKDTFKTKLGYADVSHLHTIGNCSFIMLGCTIDHLLTVDHTFLGDSLTSQAANNCFIMSHANRYLTTCSTDTDYAGSSANVEAAVGSKKFVAWFAGHSHGYIQNSRKLTQAKYLNLGDNN